jgi:hypothetical protein
MQAAVEHAPSKPAKPATRLVLEIRPGAAVLAAAVCWLEPGGVSAL